MKHMNLIQTQQEQKLSGIISSKKINPDDVGKEMRLLSDCIGFDAVLTLAKIYGGKRIYIHKYDSIARAARNRLIKTEFTGENVRQLAKRYKLTTTRIKIILGMPK